MNALLQLLQRYANQLVAKSAGGSVEGLLRELTNKEHVFAELLRGSLLRGYLSSAKRTASRLPTSIFANEAAPPFRPPWDTATASDADGENPVYWPGIQASADWLSRRRLLLPGDFHTLDEQAQSAAFTVARSATLDAVERVRDAVRHSVVVGDTLPEFRERVQGSLHESMLSPNRVETLYRTHVGQATAAGQRAVIEHPLVADEFPYLLFSATHDSRTEPSHLAMEKHGQNGTAVYRRDDPIWNTLWPPIRWNCRCAVIALGVDDAAKHGSREAARWLKTGDPPTSPEFAKRPYPVTPPKGWPSHEGIAAVV